VLDHPVTPIAGHSFVGNVFAVDERSASGQQRGWGFRVTVMTLACFYSGRTRGRVFVATHAGGIVGLDAAGHVIKAGCGLRRDAMTANASDRSCGPCFTGCFEVAGEARVGVHGEVALGANRRVATDAAKIGTTVECSEVIGVTEEVGLMDVQRLPQSVHGVAAAAQACRVIDRGNWPVGLSVSDRGDQL